MSERLEFPSSMTGSTNLGPLQPQKDSSTLPPRSSPFDLYSTPESPARRGHRQRLSRKMSLTSVNGQPIQLTPLWEHVVRTRKFPGEVDTRLTFLEISERLRDPEWEVRQHALRVLIDVLPTLNADIVDKVMQPVLPELVNNLGHPAPAVRKGVLDAFRVFLIHSRDRENTIKSSPAYRQRVSHFAPQLFPLPFSRVKVETKIEPRSPANHKHPSACSAAHRNDTAIMQTIYDLRISPLSNPVDRYPSRITSDIPLQILQDGLNRSEVRDSFQTNVTTGVILSVPSLLFPSSSSPSPNPQLIKDTTVALASRLAQVPHQEAVLKSLTKIRDAVGVEVFESYLEDYDNKLKRNIEVLSKIYNVKSGRKAGRNKNDDTSDPEKLGGKHVEGKWDSDSDTSGIAEEEDEVSNAAMPAARVVLETEIKFNEETAITMTILEEKDSEEEREEEEESGTDVKNEAEGKDDSADRRKTPRRVHFGGEIVKLRTPDSDDTEAPEVAPKTRIPLPVSPATTMPNSRPRSSSQPCSPKKEAGKPGATVRSVSSSPKREIYVHNAELSPKKSILSRNSSPSVAGRSEQSKRKNNIVKLEDKDNNAEPKADAKHLKTVETVGKGEELKKDDVKRGSSRNGERSSLMSNVKIVGSENSETLSSSEDKMEIVLSRNDSRIESSDSKMDVERGAEVVVRETRSSLESRASKINGETNREERSREADSFFGSTVRNIELGQQNRVRPNKGGVRGDANETVPRDSGKLRGGATRNGNGDRESLRNVDCERTSRCDRDKGNASLIEKNGNAGCGGGEIQSTAEEQSWEELGLVGQEVLEDLHNKDDWRARVRGLERVASALRTSSALIAIEPRLGSLLHAVLGCERSCRVAAAGMAVAKVVIAGVSEEALKKRLPQLAWGLSRQGGPSAAQLARITMLRVRPALLLEQLLQPQCLNARNAKTRENTLQLLIFSLVTFPSTEFKVDKVANKVAKMVRDRRRRVRQAALDTLAVLAQIYEPEEVLAAGKRASEGHHDGQAMMSAIRARLARKSLPLVSADGLVMYGLQISPTVQIATGPDVDWIVAGSGSVSPGIGRSKGQAIATRLENEKFARHANANYRENPWGERQNFVALGVGVRSRTEQPIVWQLVPTQNQDMQCEDELTLHTNRNANAGIRNGESFNSDLKSRNQAKSQASSRESNNYLNNFDKRDSNNKAESRIPVLYHRDCGIKATGHSLLMDKSGNPEIINANLTRRLRDTTMNCGHGTSQEETVRNSGTAYQQRRKHQQENSTSMQYDNYRLMKNINNANADYKNGEENSNERFPDGNFKFHQKFLERDRLSRKSDSKSRYTRSSSVEGRPPSLSKNSQQQTFVIQNIYNTSLQREGRFTDENSFRPLHTYGYSKPDFNQGTEESNDKSMSRSRSHRRTKDVGAQKFHNVEVSSSDAQTGEYFPAICPETPYRRRLRSLSPTQLYQRQQFVRMAANEVHALSMYDIDKAVYEEEYNEKNKHHFLPEDSFGDLVDAPSEGDDHELSSSDALETNDQQDTEQDAPDTQDDSDTESSNSERQNDDAAFDIITGQSSPSGRDTVDFIISLGQTVEAATETPMDGSNDGSKEWSSEEEPRSKNQSRAVSRTSEDVEFAEENQNESELSTSDETGRTDEPSNVEETAVVSVFTPEPAVTNECMQTSGDISHPCFEEAVPSPSRRSASPKKSSRPSSQNSVDLEASISSRRNSRSSSRKLSFQLEDKESVDSSEERPASSAARCDDDSTQSEEPVQTEPELKAEESPAIIIASRPHSSSGVSDSVENHAEASVEAEENNNARFVSEPNENKEPEDEQCRDSSSETNMEPGILKIETQPPEPVVTTKRKACRVPRAVGRGRSKGNSDKTKPVVQQCFAQLESKDWEITIKGLKTLSHIAKQQPEYLDATAAATISRLVGRQIKSLRSQVARTACSTAADIFSSQIRGIDQDFDDIAGPLLHRTADTNRFLRADSNGALDRMVEHLPPQKTIGVIVSRGASHQNAIVRAATARLLTSVVDRVGPDQTLILPKDARDKLLSTGARLLIDGNLDARNHAKKMFKRLTRCEGFRKALTDSVPETTLRHIDKTLKTL